MRTSKDEYIMPDGSIIALSQDQQPPVGAKIYNGYDYDKQEWVFQSQKDTRTLEQLQKAQKVECRTCFAKVKLTEYNRCPDCSAYQHN